MAVLLPCVVVRPKLDTMSRYLLGLGLILLCGTAHSTIVSGNAASTGGDKPGQFVLLEVPFTNPKGQQNRVGGNSFDEPNLYGLDEAQQFTLTTDLVTDNGTIAAGTIVNSHYVIFDPLDRTNNVSVTGSVTFDGDILGVITQAGTLKNSLALKNPDVQYVSNALARQYETGDSATFSTVAPRTVFFNLTSTSGAGDYARVITALAPSDVPEPSSLMLAALGMAGSFVPTLFRRGGKQKRSTDHVN